MIILYYKKQELLKYMLDSDMDNDGILDFNEFKVMINSMVGLLSNNIESNDVGATPVLFYIYCFETQVAIKGAQQKLKDKDMEEKEKL